MLERAEQSASHCKDYHLMYLPVFFVPEAKHEGDDQGTKGHDEPVLCEGDGLLGYDGKNSHTEESDLCDWSLLDCKGKDDEEAKEICQATCQIERCCIQLENTCKRDCDHRGPVRIELSLSATVLSRKSFIIRILHRCIIDDEVGLELDDHLFVVMLILEVVGILVLGFAVRIIGTKWNITILGIVDTEEGIGFLISLIEVKRFIRSIVGRNHDHIHDADEEADDGEDLMDCDIALDPEEPNQRHQNHSHNRQEMHHLVHVVSVEIEGLVDDPAEEEDDKFHQDEPFMVTDKLSE